MRILAVPSCVFTMQKFRLQTLQNATKQNRESHDLYKEPLHFNQQTLTTVKHYFQRPTFLHKIPMGKNVTDLKVMNFIKF